MEALRFITRPVGGRVTINLPLNMQNEELEIIVLSSSKKSPIQKKCRRPPADLSKTVLYDDLIAPAVMENEWDALQ